MKCSSGDDHGRIIKMLCFCQVIVLSSDLKIDHWKSIKFNLQDIHKAKQANIESDEAKSKLVKKRLSSVKFCLCLLVVTCLGYSVVRAIICVHCIGMEPYERMG